ncbi:MAG: hypothetical protein OEZ39_07925 [Gammaproteobacteria bacterium]|nr:hypothetical protein [Gammaproteobacteria bacterium]MDH5651788.1 hypothetical protein [Gammaproteobacteria bacterium]
MNEIRDYAKPVDAVHKAWQVFLKVLTSILLVALCGAAFMD